MERCCVPLELIEAMCTKLKVLATLFTLALGVCQAQTVVPASLPELKYPPIARVARVQGDVVVSFRWSPEGKTIDVTPISGPPLLQGSAVENVRSWRFEQGAEFAGQAVKVTFHFRLNPPNDGYDDGQPATRVELDGTDGVQVISILTTGLERSECPTAAERVPPLAVINGDFVEVRRWNETIRVGADGSALWEQGKNSQRGQIISTEAESLLERFRAPAVWALCGSYYQAGLMDGGGSSFKVRIGGREKSVSEYGDVAPPIFREVELLVDAASNTHQWRHGDPSTESIVEISYEYLPKPGKTKLMDAASDGDEVHFRAALAAGEKLTDVDASGWTPLMYAAGSHGNSEESAILKARVDVNARSMRGRNSTDGSCCHGHGR
jgi:TonB family protein